ncbi:helix-turn-helix transcriptional regulator [Nocardia neocaledoniensis]|uniref:helix-turn-helix transcriptional regulator n=1 Tax=Nocardia neocaledoniensis TaxID=236511 RepID=UPI0033EA1D12
MSGNPDRWLVSSADVAESDAVSYWESRVSESFGRVAIDLVPDQPFYGSFQRLWSSPELLIARSETSGHGFRHTARQVARADRHSFTIMFAEAGHRVVVDDDGTTRIVGAGAITITDSSYPHRFFAADRTRALALSVPREVLADRAGAPALAPMPMTVLDAGGPASVIANFFRDALTHLDLDGEDSDTVLGGHGTDMLAALLRLVVAPDAAIDSVAVRRAAVMDYLRTHFTRAGLTVEAVAAACHLSRRSLYRCFDDIDGGPAEVVRRMRLDHARLLLASHPDTPITEIAQRSGFATERQFYRAFRTATGMTPGDYRTGHESAEASDSAWRADTPTAPR